MLGPRALGALTWLCHNSHVTMHVSLTLSTLSLTLVAPLSCLTRLHSTFLFSLSAVVQKGWVAGLGVEVVIPPNCAASCCLWSLHVGGLGSHGWPGVSGGTQGREDFKGKLTVMALRLYIVAHLSANTRAGLQVLRTVTRLHSWEASQYKAWVTCGTEPCL